MSKLKYLLGAALLLVLGIGVPVAKGANMFYLPSSASTGVASTTSAFIIGGTGTTTKTITSDGYEQVSWLVALASSSTPPTLCWINQYSNDGTDWYTEDQVYASSSPIHIASEKQECWTYATTSATQLISRGSDGKTLFVGRRIVVPNLGTAHTRTIFSIEPGVNARLDVKSALKNEIVLTK